MHFSAVPTAQGLYRPTSEADGCGVTVVADLSGRAARGIVTDALSAVGRLRHRGAAGAEPSSGDGAGILVQLPDRLLRAERVLSEPERVGAHRYAAGIAFLPTGTAARDRARAMVSRLAEEEGLRVLGWRGLKVDPDRMVGDQPGSRWTGARSACAAGSSGPAPPPVASPTSRPCPPARWSTRGCSPASNCRSSFPDLRDQRLESAIALVHSRFSTNTFPSWPLAQPFRYVAHNGEINTIRGNRNRMRAREALLWSSVIPGDLGRLFTICTDGVSDSASFAHPVPMDEVEPAGDRASVRHRSHVLRLVVRRSPPDARDRDEPAGWAVQLRGGRRGHRPAVRPATSRSRWPREPNRGRAGNCPGSRCTPGSRAPGCPPRSGVDLPAAASRHLPHRGPRPADPRPEERQSPRPGACEAGQLGRGRHGGRRSRQGARRRGAHLRS